jgi:integrase/recombinase XerD
MTSLRQAVEDYLSLRHSLGFKLRCPGALLRKFAAFAEAVRAGLKEQQFCRFGKQQSM